MRPAPGSPREHSIPFSVKQACAFASLPEFKISVPTLVLWGTEDVVFVSANVDLGTHPDYPGVQTLDDFATDLTVRKFSDAGHFIQHQKPVDLAADIKDFVDRVMANSER